MEKVVLVLAAAFALINVNAQISTIKIEVSEKKEMPIIMPYDSLFSINKDNYKSHIGQTLFVKEDKDARKRGYYNFYTKPFL